MYIILIPTLIIAGVGAICGVILSIASVAMAVPVDEQTEAVKAALPGANCGGCGFPGCDGFAAAVASGNAPVTGCAPGGAGTAQALAAIMGIEPEKEAQRSAVVRCGGCTENSKQKMRYAGAQSCAFASQLYGGSSVCSYSCLGFGDCAVVCDYGAINVINERAVVDPALCVGCKKCIAACPKGLIAMTPVGFIAGEMSVPAVICNSRDMGAVVRKFCSVGCIGCKLCVKSCPRDAITFDHFLAEVDFTKCAGCGECALSCPQKTIRMI